MSRGLQIVEKPMGFFDKAAVPLPREVNSRSRAAFNLPFFEKPFKNKDLFHIYSANRSAEKNRLSKKDFFDSLKAPALAGGLCSKKK
jgi:hypothetical protein